MCVGKRLRSDRVWGRPEGVVLSGEHKGRGWSRVWTRVRTDKKVGDRPRGMGWCLELSLDSEIGEGWRNWEEEKDPGEERVERFLDVRSGPGGVGRE